MWVPEYFIEIQVEMTVGFHSVEIQVKTIAGVQL